MCNTCSLVGARARHIHKMWTVFTDYETEVSLYPYNSYFPAFYLTATGIHSFITQAKHIIYWGRVLLDNPLSLDCETKDLPPRAVEILHTYTDLPKESTLNTES